MLAPAYREVRGAWEARDHSASKSARCALSLSRQAPRLPPPEPSMVLSSFLVYIKKEKHGLVTYVQG